MDYIKRREKPLKVEVYKGSIASKHECLLNTDAVIAIELIEHLIPSAFDELPGTVFGYIRPKIAVFTTPNVEANILFPDLQGFRHDDHKFEWTRKEFEDWAYSVCQNYPEYKVQFYQIGIGPPDKLHLDFGGISQCVIFLRSDMVQKLEQYLPKENNAEQELEVAAPVGGGARLMEPRNEPLLPVPDDVHEELEDLEDLDDDSDHGEDEEIVEDFFEMASPARSEHSDYSSDDEYKLILEVDYPFFLDTRSDNEKILDEAKYQIQRLSRIDQYLNEERNLCEIPVTEIFNLIFPLVHSLSQLKHILLDAGYQITEENIIEVSVEADDGVDSNQYSSHASDNEIEEQNLNDHNADGIPVVEEEMWE